MTVRLVDIETRRVVREFKGFLGRILDIVCCLLVPWLKLHENLDLLA